MQDVSDLIPWIALVALMLRAARSLRVNIDIDVRWPGDRRQDKGSGR